MKKDMVDYISRCMKCQQVKVEPKHPIGLLQPFPVPEWKWEVISMDFITGFPMNWRQHDSIMVVVDKLTKVAHFIPVKSTYEAGDIVKIFMKEIFKLHGFLKAIVSDRDVKFTSNFWKGLFVDLGTVIPKVEPRLRDSSLRKSLFENVKIKCNQIKNTSWYQTRANRTSQY